MIVTLVYDNKLYTLTLPLKIEGQFFLGNSEKKDLIRIIGNNNKWILKSNKKVKILDEEEKELKSINLESENIYYLDIEGQESFVFCEPLTENRQVYKKFLLKGEVNIKIGRLEDNDISYQKAVVSSNHALLTYRNKYWEIEDKKSTNGTFVNNEKITKKTLEYGDVIYIMGLKIIIGNGFLALNHPDNLVFINEAKFTLKEEIPYLEMIEEDDEEENEINYFYRSPRLKRPLEKEIFKIDAPPNSLNKEKMPLALTVGPMVTMGLASLSSTYFALNNALVSGNFTAYLPSIAMSGSMLLGTLLWPSLTKAYESKMRKKHEEIRNAKYLEYLNNIEEKINIAMDEQIKILKESIVSIDECEERILKTSRLLWERTLWQDDFLKLRVGIGDVPFLADINYPEPKFTLDTDLLMSKMYELCEKPKILQNVPIALSIYENYFCGIIGDRKKVLDFAKGLIIELAALYSYDEVKMIFIYNEKNQEELAFVKWLPHVFSNDKKFRFIATNPDECKELSYYLDDEIQVRLEASKENLEEMPPYYVIFVLDKNLGLKAEILKNLYAKKRNLNFSILNFYQELQDLPKECSMVIELDENSAKMYDKNNITSKTIYFKEDISLTADPLILSKKLANTFLDNLNGDYKLPSVIPFLQMFEAGSLEHLNILRRWQENDPVKSLATPIGMNSYGELFYLDLHEKYHGPHGLVAGMTGSGKSEFIISYILSLAVNYHPHEVSFILIDYKGGGMAKSFANLPHIAGIITNLDGASITRALVSINSELQRRQVIFDDVSHKLGISNIDIYKYQKLYRDNEVAEPLPHLFIISDEFAELKKERPEFMSKLISAARIGRSLGIHLILATQKPSGVVDDQIWSNSKFRICLKVQEKNDSMDMLKRPDAALLKDTGRFYLQVGYNELFELGQSAWAGALYYPSETYQPLKDEDIVVIDNNHRVLKRVRKEKNPLGRSLKQLDALTKFIEELAYKEKINSLPIWLPPLKENILLSDLKQKYKNIKKDFILNPIIGELDDPVCQRQTVLSLPLSKLGHALIYGSSGTSKDMFVNTLVYSLITTYDPNEVNLYLLDFESETLSAFKKSPHVGEIMLASDSEKITNLFKKLYEELELRKKEFLNYGGTYNTYIENSGQTIPNIVIIISNYVAFIETYPEQEEIINYLVREGTKYGLYFVLTAGSANSVKYKIAQNFAQVLTLNLNDEAMYSLILGKTDNLVPNNYEGRGLVKLDKNIYEFQTARITTDNPYSFIVQECQKITSNYIGDQASSIKILPSKITSEVLNPYVTKKLLIPFGMKKSNLEITYLDLPNNYINLILSSDKSYLEFCNALTNFIAETYQDCTVRLIDIKGDLNEINSKVEHISSYTSNISDELYNLVLKRNNTYKEALENKSSKVVFEPIIYIINSYIDLIEGGTIEEKEKIDLALEKGKTTYGVYFIIFESQKKANFMASKKWYHEQIKLENGLWFGSGFNNQYTYIVSSTTNDTKKELSADFAIFINKGRASLVKVLTKEDVHE